MEHSTDLGWGDFFYLGSSSEWLRGERVCLSFYYKNFLVISLMVLASQNSHPCLLTALTSMVWMKTQVNAHSRAEENTHENCDVQQNFKAVLLVLWLFERWNDSTWSKWIVALWDYFQSLTSSQPFAPQPSITTWKGMQQPLYKGMILWRLQSFFDS